MSAERDDELRRLREAVAKLRADSNHCREMADLPSLSPEQRHVIAWAFRGGSE